MGELFDRKQSTDQTGIAERLFEYGYARVRLSPIQAKILAGTMRRAEDIFTQGPDHNARYTDTKNNQGYRLPEKAHGGNPDFPDTNDSFLYRGRVLARHIPYSDEITIKQFIHSLEAHRLSVRWIARSVIAAIANHYRYERTLGMEQGSFLQINSYRGKSTREMLQTPHDDRTYLTILSATAPGLEYLPSDGPPQPITPAPDEVVVMPGGILTLMTGGQIPPFIHRVINPVLDDPDGIINRQSAMYFVSPNTSDGEILPYIQNDVNQGVDIRQAIIDAPTAFGKPKHTE